MRDKRPLGGRARRVWRQSLSALRDEDVDVHFVECEVSFLLYVPAAQRHQSLFGRSCQQEAVKVVRLECREVTRNMARCMGWN